MSKWRALVAEDSTMILFGLEMALELSDIEIAAAAATLSKLRKLAETENVDVAILDVNLNGEMVFPVADQLIARGIPIVFTTGYAPEKIFPRHLRGQPVLLKPYDCDELLRVVEHAITRGQAKAG
jgi:DNA-binding response OmpR family regulator